MGLIVIFLFIYKINTHSSLTHEALGKKVSFWIKRQLDECLYLLLQTGSLCNDRMTSLSLQALSLSVTHTHTHRDRLDKCSRLYPKEARES